MNSNRFTDSFLKYDLYDQSLQPVVKRHMVPGVQSSHNHTNVNAVNQNEKFNEYTKEIEQAKKLVPSTPQYPIYYKPVELFYPNDFESQFYSYEEMINDFIPSEDENENNYIEEHDTDNENGV